MTGAIKQSITTDENGNYATDKNLVGLVGHYTIEVCDKRSNIEEKDRYRIAYRNIIILGNKVMKNQNISVTSKIATNQIRIVLEWGANPQDLDSHLLGMTSDGEQKFHIYYGNKTYSENGIIVADLDLDDIALT